MSLYTLFWFDVEDYINPQSDEALKGLLQVFEEHGVQATWKIVGEKARVLEQRGRSDIIRLLQRQDIGYHTDLHSQHPVLAEYLDAMGWEDGIAELLRRESGGYEDLLRICGPASTFGQAGGSWAPQLCPAMRHWGIPLFMDEASHIGLDHRAFWYGGVLHINRLGPYCTRMDFAAGAAGLDRGKRDFDTLCAKVGAADGLASIYYHPCEWVADAFWDAANFARGANPPRSEWQLPSLRSSTQMAAGLQLFSEYLAYVKSRPNVEILTGRQIINLLPDRVRQRRFSRAEIADLAHFADGEIGFVEKNGIALAPSELFSLVIDALCNMGANANIFAAASTPYGPTRRKNSSLSPNAKLPTSTFLGICQDLQNQLHKTHQLPDQIWIGADTLAPADFYQTATHLLRSTIVSSNLPDITPIQLGHLALEHHVRDDAWSWPIFRENFSAPNLVELGRLQTWTLKPALLSTHEGAFTPS